MRLILKTTMIATALVAAAPVAMAQPFAYMSGSVS